jgi:hypothetical protein
MKVRWTLLTDASGSVGGVTAARARGGIDYLRARVTPVNPNTTRQQVVRAAMSSASTDWRDTLTPTERESWAALADGTDSSGIGQFNKGNVARIQAGMDPVLEYDPALVEVAPELGSPTNSAAVISLPWTSTGWEDVDGAGLLIYVGKPKPPSRTYEQREKFATVILGDSTTAPTSPATFLSPWGNAYSAGDTSTIRAMFVDPSGRYVLADTAELTWS